MQALTSSLPQLTSYDLYSTHIGAFLTAPFDLPLPTSSRFFFTLTYSFALFAVFILTVIIYRLYFHSLSRYPGPFLAKLTPLHSAYHAWKGNRHLVLYEAHKKYGPIVRWAPNCISINSAIALKEIYGHGGFSRLVQKSEFYKAFPAVKGVHNTHNAIDKTVHGRKRRVLSHAFSENALKGLEGLVIKNIDIFFNSIEERMAKGIDLLRGKDGKVGGIDMGEMFSWLTFDVMGELCFGRTFGMLVDEGQRFVTGLIDKAAHNHYICGNYLPLSTLKLSKIAFPTIARDRWRFILHSRACADERMKMHAAGQDTDKRDFFHYLLNAEDPETGRGFDKAELWGEANILMIAGSDTTSTALSAALYYLLHNPDKLEKAKKEVREKFASVPDIVSGKELNDCVYLKACIDEAMRICPPVPGLLPREVIAPRGITIDCTAEGKGKYFFPQGTVIGVPIYTIHHNPEYYPYPFEFQPERWISSGNSESHIVSQKSSNTPSSFNDAMVTKAQSAYTPFSIGARGCIGRSLALMELKLTMGRLLFEWEVEYIGGVEGKGENWKGGCKAEGGPVDEFRMLDHFTARKEGPVVSFEKRVGL